MRVPWTAPGDVLPLREPYGGLKDPCVVLHQGTWHLFATGCKDGYAYDVVHATAPHPAGPWTYEAPSDIVGHTGPSACAPGVVSDGDTLHMFLQETYNVFGGAVTHLVSGDGGATFVAEGTALRSHAGTSEAGLYDAHPAEVGGTKYLVYSGFATVGEPDLHLARATDWAGPWERLGPILTHDDVPCHNPRGCEAYEWGLEGGQLAELPDGRTLLLGVCFLPNGTHGARQRAFVAVADRPQGPYAVLGPAMEPAEYGRPGENGHGCAVVHDGEVHLFFQHRDGEGPPWTLHVVSADAASIPRSPSSLESVA